MYVFEFCAALEQIEPQSTGFREEGSGRIPGGRDESRGAFAPDFDSRSLVEQVEGCCTGQGLGIAKAGVSNHLLLAAAAGRCCTRGTSSALII